MKHYPSLEAAILIDVILKQKRSRQFGQNRRLSYGSKEGCCSSLLTDS